MNAFHNFILKNQQLVDFSKFIYDSIWALIPALLL